MRFYYNQQADPWDDFILSAGPKQTEFLQSYTWGEIMRKADHSIFRLYGVDDNNNWLVASFVYKIKGIFNYNYWYSPRGPFLSDKILSRLNYSKTEAWRLVLSSWYKEASRAKVMLVKFEPGALLFEEKINKQNQLESEIMSVAKSLGFKIRKSQSVQPSSTQIIDLSIGEEELKKQMKAKTRYNIRLAQKKSLSISWSKDNFEDFYNLLIETSKRDKFRLHPKEHYLNILKNGKEKIKLVCILDKDKVIAGGLFSFFGKKIVYMHGASDYQVRQKMAPYLLHFYIIKKGIELNYRYYDLHGIDEKRWPGVTRFKKGFGGYQLDYPGTYDLIVSSSRYASYLFLKKLKNNLNKLKRKIKF